jgi:hypothetical protein
MDINIQLPETLNEISLDQYMKYVPMIEDIEDEKFLLQKTVEILCKVHLDTVRKMKLTSIEEITEHLGQVLEQKPKFENTFWHNGIEYGFIEKLDDISFGEYIDLDTYLTDKNNLDKAMSILYRPIKGKIGDEYTIEEYNGKINNDLKDMPMGIALGAVFFFTNLSQELLIHTATYLQEMEMTKTQTMDSQKDGVGIKASILLAKDELTNLTALQNYP